jgi:hypothetical protein
VNNNKTEQQPSASQITTFQSSSQERKITTEPDFRNFFGITWRGTACDNLAYAKAMGYDYVLLQGGMSKCSNDIKSGMKFYIESPETMLATNVYTSSIDVTKTYSQSDINKLSQVFIWKGNATTSTAFPGNIATGWWFSNITFRPYIDLQQQIMVDAVVSHAISKIAPSEDKSIGWEFGGWAWDVPDFKGDWWTERQAGYTGSSWMCGDRACKGKGVSLAYWNPTTGIDSGALHGNITHQYSSYPEAYAATRKKIFTETLKLYPNMKIVYEPYGAYDYINSMNSRSDKGTLMPAHSVLLCQEGGDSPSKDIAIFTDTRITSSTLIDEDYLCSSTPDVHNITRNIIIAGTAATQGAWFTFFGRWGGTDGTPNYASVREVPRELLLIRAIPGWDNMNGVALPARTFDKTNKIYKSTLSYADNNVMYSRHPKNGDLYATILSATGKIVINGGEQVKEIYSTDQLMQRSTLATADFNVNGQELTLKGSDNYGKAYIIVTQKETIDQCQSIVCNDKCEGNTLFKSGVCQSGTCQYTQIICQYGCESGACKTSTGTTDDEPRTTPSPLEDKTLWIIGGVVLVLIYLSTRKRK